MATLSLADFSDALSVVYRDEFQDQINRQVVLANLLPVKEGGGKAAFWTAKFTGRADGAGYTEGADMADGDFDSEIREDATLSWAQYRKGAKVSGLASAANGTDLFSQSAAGAAKMDLLLDEVHDAIDRLALGVGKDLYTGVGSAAAPVIGLDTALLDSGIYAGIDSATYDEHKATVQSVGLVSLSFSVLRAYHTAVYEACGEMPEFCVMPSAIFDAVGDLFGSERRYVSEVMTAAGGLIKLRGGFKALEIDGIPYVRDRHATAGTIYAMNSRYCRITELPAWQSPMTADRIQQIVKRMTGRQLPTAELEGMMARNSGLRPYCDRLAKTGDSDKVQVKWYGQLEIRRRNAFGRLTLT